MTIVATWNINSVRLRLPLIKRLVEEAAPDILCLQETKVEDSLFPSEALRELGFRYTAFSGQKSYNGVAILSKKPCEFLECQTIAGAPDKRHIAVRLPDGTELHNFYVPAGGDIPDPEQNPAFGFKLRFVEAMTQWAKNKSKSDRLIIVGDFNIAPLPHDVWSHKQLLNVVSHTPVEVERLDALKQSLDWCDVARNFVNAEEKLYSWWSYRNRDWRASNHGRRLDHIWVSQPLIRQLKDFRILKDVRDWKSPSDHVPVITKFSF